VSLPIVADPAQTKAILLFWRIACNPEEIYLQDLPTLLYPEYARAINVLKFQHQPKHLTDCGSWHQTCSPSNRWHGSTIDAVNSAPQGAGI